MNKKIQYLLFPRRCVACDMVLDFGRYKYGFCKKCKNKITYAKEPVCKVCGKVIIDNNGERCNDCIKKKHYFLQSKEYMYMRAQSRALCIALSIIIGEATGLHLPGIL